MQGKKALLLALGAISGMAFIFGLDVLTARLSAKLRHDFKSWNILRYDLEAKIDNLTVMERDGRNVPVRYRYTEEMQLNCYCYHTPTTWKRVVMMELLTKKITSESITVNGTDATLEIGPAFARRLPAPGYLFLDFDKYGEIASQRRAAGIRDMIVSTYSVRRLPRETAYTRDTWSGEVDMGPFITSYKWRFNGLQTRKDGDNLADIGGGGEFFEEGPGGARGDRLGSYTYAYTLGVKRKGGYIRQAEGSFDLRSRQGDSGTSYREKFVQKLSSIDEIPTMRQRDLAEQFEALREVLKQEELGDARAFHNSLVSYLRQYPGSLLWENLLALLNGLRIKCGEEPVDREDILEEPEEGTGRGR